MSDSGTRSPSGQSIFWVLALAVCSLGLVGAARLELWPEAKEELWPEAKEEVWVPKDDIPVYHRIVAAELTQVQKDKEDLPSGIVKSGSSLEGRYTLETLSKGDPMTADQLGPHVPRGTLKDRVAVAVEVSSAGALRGKVAPGDEVRVLPVASSWGKTVPEELRFNDVVVLEVEPTAKDSESKKEAGRYVVVLAVPEGGTGRVAQAGAGKGWQIYRSTSE